MNFFILIEARQGQRIFATLWTLCIELGMVSIIAIVKPGIPHIFQFKKKPTSMKKHHNFDPAANSIKVELQSSKIGRHIGNFQIVFVKSLSFIGR